MNRILHLHMNVVQKKIVTAAVALVAAVTFLLVLAPSVSAAGWTSMGTQVLKNSSGKYVSAKIYACKTKISGTSNYRVTAKSVLPAAGGLSGYQLKIGSNLGSSTSNQATLKYSPNARANRTTTVTSKGQAKNTSSIKFSAYITKKGSSGYTVYSGTTITSRSITSITTC